MTVETLNQMDPGITCTEIDDGLVIHLAGEWDLTGAPGLQAAIKHAQALAPSRLIVDLSDATAIDSSVLAVLIEAEQNARITSLLVVLCGLLGAVRSVFEIARVFEEPFIIVDDVDAARVVPNRRRGGRRRVTNLVCAQGVILDLSPGGMRLLSPKKLDGSVELEFGLGKQLFTVTACVAWSRPTRARRKEYGLRFTDMDASARDALDRAPNLARCEPPAKECKPAVAVRHVSCGPHARGGTPMQTRNHLSFVITTLALTAGAAAQSVEFSDDVRFDTEGTTVDLTVDDFNNDAATDVAVVDEDGSIVVFANDGNGVLFPGDTIDLPQIGGPVSSIVSADFNDDGYVDLAAMGSFDSAVYVLLNTGDLTFAAPLTLEPPNFTFSSALEAADMDGDGDVDLILNQPPVVFINDGNAGFEDFALFPGGPVPSQHGVGDLNGDGLPDIVSTDFNLGARITYNEGDNVYTEGPTLAAGPSVIFPLIVDINDDGLGDILVANSIGRIGGEPGETGRITILLNEGEGQFADPTFVEVGDNPRHLAVSDVNGDRVLDIVAANSESGSASIVLGNGDGTFKRDVMYGNDPGRVAVVDMNDDDRKDIVMTSGGVTILFNEMTPQGPKGDVNGDGVVDILDLLILLGNWG